MPYNPNESRDENGRWTGGGTLLGSSQPPPPPRSWGEIFYPTMKEPARSNSSTFRSSGAGPSGMVIPVAQDGPVDFTNHGIGRLQSRGLTPGQVIDAINNGTRTLQPNGNTMCVSGRVVVIINPLGGVVTCYER